MAETAITTQASAATSALSGGASAVAETALWLMLVVGLILLLAWLAKRFGGVQFRHHGSMRVLSVLPVGNREKIVLVQAGDTYLLLGVTPAQVNTLHVFDELPRDLSVSSARSAASAETGEPGSGFQQLLRFALSNRSAPNAGNPPGNSL